MARQTREMTRKECCRRLVGREAAFLPIRRICQRDAGSTLILLLFTFFGVFSGQLLSAADTSALVNSWLNSQTNIQTWSADFVQTRTLKSFSQPLISTGQVWFAAPERFRWELGNPPQTIAVKNPEQMLVIYPKLKRVEKFPLKNIQSGQWKDTLALLEAGFPRSREEMESRFRIQSVEMKNEICEVTLQPKSTSARKMMPQLKIAFATNDFSLRATELQFADGSTMRNDFKDPKLNEKFDDSMFAPKIDESFKIVEPLKGKP